MLLSNRIRAMSGVASHRFAWEVPDHDCPGRFEHDVVYYVDLEQWPSFPQVVESGELQLIRCNTCGSEGSVKSPVIVEVPTRNLLIFVTHGGDDGGAVLGFHAQLGTAAGLLPPAVGERAQVRPFTIVHGWIGFQRLLNALDGIAVPPEHHGPHREYPHPLDRDGFQVYTINGYTHGGLFFHLPEHAAVNELVSCLLHWSRFCEDQVQIARVLEAMLGLVSLSGSRHPWLLQELGRIHLELGENDTAIEFLEGAVEAHHCWLAVTTSFLDATPRTCAEFPLQEPGLPHAVPASELGMVTTRRHVVVRTRPAVSDYGLWHFPRTEQHAHPSNYTNEGVWAAHGLALGVMDRTFLDEGEPARDWNFPPAYGGLLEDWQRLLEQASRAVGVLTGDGRVAAFHSGPSEFWMQYLRSRWLGRLSIEWHEVPERIDLVLAEIEKARAKLSEDEQNELVRIVTSNYSNSHRYFLDTAENLLRGQV